MNISEKFGLKWSNFRENVYSAFGELREDRDLADVTLACADGHQVEAHKVVLAASSPFFQNILRRNKHPHPLIYMRGMDAEDLVAIVDFLYYGEANIYQEKLDGFLAIAEELDLKGLSGENFDNIKGKKEPKPSIPNNTMKTEIAQAINLNQLYQIKDNMVGSGDTTKFTVSVNIQDLDEKIQSMMSVSEVNRDSKGLPARICTVCGKEGQWAHVRDHIEVHHITGISHPCNICHKISKTRATLRAHTRTFHKNGINTTLY
jgi:hypothetical protein